MRVLIFHGYLLRGTGSNIYNASLARALVDLGHEVHLVCQERETAGLDFVDGERCTVHVPDIEGLLPLYVADEYEGFEAVPFPDLDDERIERYVELNVRAVAAVAREVEPDVALANHLVMGPVILARALEGRVPYAVKVHGSALEYVVRPHRERFIGWAREGLAGASAVLAGSRHTAESLWEVMDDPDLPARTRLGPPGVDVHRFRPRSPEEAAEGLTRLADSLEGSEAASWGGEPGAAEALRAIDPARDRVVGYVGKLIVSKGVDLLLAAWPLVVAEVAEARLCVVGFGTYREGLGRIVAALAAADLDELGEVAARGRELEGGPRDELSYLRAFLDGSGWASAARPTWPRRPGGRGAGPLHRPAGARRPARPAAGIRGPGGAQHVSRGVRHGGRRGGVLRGAAGVRRALRAGGGLRGSGPRAGRAAARAAGLPAGPRGGARAGGPAGAVAVAGPRRAVARQRRAGRPGALALQLGDGGRGGHRRSAGAAGRPSRSAL